MEHNWRSAFFAQARSDFYLLKQLDELGASSCHCFHYLQMTAEKLSKGFASPANGRGADPPPPKTHSAFVHFIRLAKRMSEIRRACNFGNQNNQQYKAYLDRLITTAEKVEKLAPALRPPERNTEYPWQENIIDRQNINRRRIIIQVPAEYSFEEIIDKPEMMRLMQFLDSCFSAVL